MPDTSFDVVVIGGGHQGLLIANYMAMNGMTVGLFDQKNELGGGAATLPIPAAGFLGNPHANGAGFYAHPANQDFNLREKGLRYKFSDVACTMAFPDDKCIVTYNATDYNDQTGELTPKPEVIEKNITEMARISKRDAETLAKFAARVEKWAYAFTRCVYNPPPLPGEPNPLEELLDDPGSGLDRRYYFLSAYDMANDLFDSPELKTLFLRQMAASGIYPNDICPLSILLFCLTGLVGLAPTGVFVGGTHNVAHSLQRSLSEQGGKFYVGADVDQIIVENGIARGIILADGSEITANQMVITSIEIKQTINRHFRNAGIDPEIRRKINNLRTDRGNVFWAHIAIHELPDYKAKSFNPDMGKGRWNYMGEPDVEYLFHDYQYQQQHMKPGNWPEKMYIYEFIDSQWDQSYAPPGKHVALFEETAPPASWRTEREWLKLREECIDHIINEWQKYAPNMKWDNIIATQCDTPLDAQQRSANFVDGCWGLTACTASQDYTLRPIPELSQYQIPGINNFYMASGSCHFSYAVMGFAAYNCYKRIAQSLGLKKPWEEQGRPY